MESQYTNTLRRKLKELVDTKKASLYRIETQTGVPRQTVKRFLRGSGIVYENGMVLKSFVKQNTIK